MSRVLDHLLENGPPLLGVALGAPEPPPGEWQGPEADAIDAYELVTQAESGEPTSDYLSLEIHVGVRFIAETVIDAAPDDEYGVWGSDLLAIITLAGSRPDWPLVDRIWTALESLWPTVPWDETSGFKIAAETSRPLHSNRPA